VTHDNFTRRQRHAVNPERWVETGVKTKKKSGGACNTKARGGNEEEG